MMESASDHLRTSRERMKAAIDLARAELDEELGVARPRAGMLLPLVAAAVGLVAAWGVRRALKGRSQRDLPPESPIDLL